MTGLWLCLDDVGIYLGIHVHRKRRVQKFLSCDVVGRATAVFPEEHENDDGHDEEAGSESACESCDLGSFGCTGVGGVVGSCGAVGTEVARRGLVDEVVEPDVMRGVVSER